MSLPREILDQLLSGYLDNSLSQDERIQLERQLAEDPSVAAELAELKTIRSDLKAIYAADLESGLGSRFPDQVVDLAVQEAKAEGLPDEHHLSRLTETPSQFTSHSVLAKSGVRLPHYVAGFVAVAASILFAVFAFQSNDDLNPGPIAGTNSGVDPSLLDEGNANGDLVDQEPQIQVADVNHADLSNQDIESLRNLENMNPEKVNPNADEPMLAEKKPQPGKISPETPPSRVTPSLPPGLDLNALASAMPVFAMQVNRTETGKLSRAVSKAIADASIEPAELKPMTAEMVAAISDTLPPDDLNGLQVLYLQLPGKKVDLLTNLLLSNQEGIDSVGFAMVTSPVVRQFVDSVERVSDAKKIRKPLTWKIEGAAALALAEELGGKEFKRVRKAKSIPDGSGADIMTQLLILVR